MEKKKVGNDIPCSDISGISIEMLREKLYTFRKKNLLIIEKKIYFLSSKGMALLNEVCNENYGGKIGKQYK